MPVIQPLILGSGGSGRALEQAFGMYPDDVARARFLDRDRPLPPPNSERDLVVVANPHALHTPRLLEAQGLGYRWALTEKPAAVNLDQIGQLATLSMPTWVCHGYRMLWGPSQLRLAVQEGRFGDLVAVEGRYWQSSAASRVDGGLGWKDDPSLGGSFDVLLDLGTHWVDLVTFVLGESPQRTEVRRWYANAVSPHRDTHLHVRQSFGEVEAFGSISKTLHGAGNHFDVVLIGSRASARWSFQNPDRIQWGTGATERTEVRRETAPPARLAPFHGLGWLEGYSRIVGEIVEEIQGRRPAQAPTLKEHLGVVRELLVAAENESSSRSLSG